LNDYQVLTAGQRLKYLVPLLTEFKRIIEKEQKHRKDNAGVINEGLAENRNTQK
jgi:hypothetical protein